MITRDHHKHTEFLKHCLCYGESAGSQELRQEITRLQREERCVRRAAWMMAAFIALTVSLFCYATILLDNFPYRQPRFVVNLICALGLGSLISLLAFLILDLVYRRKLDLRREECRRLVAGLLESRLGKPAAFPGRERTAGDQNRGPVQVPAEGNAAPDRLESAAQV